MNVGLEVMVLIGVDAALAVATVTTMTPPVGTSASTKCEYYSLYQLTIGV